MAKPFAWQGDGAAKKISFTEIGCDCVMVVDTRATPVTAKHVVEKIRTVTDWPIRYVVLSHDHAVRVLGASGYGAQLIIASEKCHAMSTDTFSN